MDWSKLYSDYISTTSEDRIKEVEFADVGCGYGGLLGKFFLSSKAFYT